MARSVSSARPQELVRYSDRAVQIDHELSSESHRLGSTLDRFERTCTEGAFRVRVGYLDDSLRAYTRDAESRDAWVRTVGLAFQNADTYSWIGRILDAVIGRRPRLPWVPWRAAIEAMRDIRIKLWDRIRDRSGDGLLQALMLIPGVHLFGGAGQREALRRAGIWGAEVRLGVSRSVWDALLRARAAGPGFGLGLSRGDWDALRRAGVNVARARLGISHSAWDALRRVRMGVAPFGLDVTRGQWDALRKAGIEVGRAGIRAGVGGQAPLLATLLTMPGIYVFGGSGGGGTAPRAIGEQAIGTVKRGAAALWKWRPSARSLVERLQHASDLVKDRGNIAASLRGLQFVRRGTKTIVYGPNTARQVVGLPKGLRHFGDKYLKHKLSVAPGPLHSEANSILRKFPRSHALAPARTFGMRLKDAFGVGKGVKGFLKSQFAVGAALTTVFNYYEFEHGEKKHLGWKSRQFFTATAVDIAVVGLTTVAIAAVGAISAPAWATAGLAVGVSIGIGYVYDKFLQDEWRGRVDTECKSVAETVSSGAQRISRDMARAASDVVGAIRKVDRFVKFGWKGLGAWPPYEPKVLKMAER